MSNAEIISRLRRLATETARNHGNLYRARAYRQAAFRISALDREITDLCEENLRNIGIGKKLSQKIYAWATAAVQPVEAIG